MKGKISNEADEGKISMISQNTQTILKWLNQCDKKTKWYIGGLLLIQAMLGICTVLNAIALREIINAATNGNNKGFWLAIIGFIGLICFRIILRAIDRYLGELTRSSLENQLKKRLFSVLLTHDYASVTMIHSGEWMNRLTSDTVVVVDGMTQILPGIISMSVQMGGAIIAIIWMEPRFLWILIPGGIILIACSYVFRRILKRLHKGIQEADGRLRVFLSERLSNLLIVRTFAKEKEMVDDAEKLMNGHQRARMKRNHFSNLSNVGFSLAMNGTYLLGAIFCGYGILTQTMSYGNFVAILQLIGQIQNPFVNITGFLPKYYAMLASAERLMEAEAFEDDSKNVLSEKAALAFYNEQFVAIGLRNVAFAYPSSQQSLIFTNLNLEIHKGEYVAFTGASGCGKSSILKIMMCLYPINNGERYLLTKTDSIPLSSAWRSLFSYVPQGNQLLAGTIREIIAFGDQERMKDDKMIWQALKTACAEEFVSSLKSGIDTVLGEGGSGLSEGQMQRIAIARAIFSNHPILLLDEATSSLDEVSEAKLLQRLRSMTDKTVIIVTHRMSVLDICDKQIRIEGISNE